MKGFIIWIIVTILTLNICYGIELTDTVVNTEQHHRTKRSVNNGTSIFNSSLATGPEWTDFNATIITSNLIPLMYNVSLPVGLHNVTVTINTTLESGENVFSLCNVNVAGIGVDIQRSATTLITLVQSTAALDVSYKVDSAVIDFGEVNVIDSVIHDPLSTLIEITFDAIVTNSSVITTGSGYNISVTTLLDDEYGNYTHDIAFVADQRVSLLSAVPPLFSLTGPSLVIIGDLITWTLVTNLRDAVNKLHVVAWVNGSYTSPGCSIYLAHAGLHYPCLNPGSFVVNKSAESLSFEIPTVINTAFNDNNTLDTEDDIRVNIQTKIPSYLTSSDNVTLNVFVYLDDKEAWNIQEPMILATGSLPTTGDVAQLLVDSPRDTVAIGASKMFMIDITAAPGSVTAYTITMETDAAVSCISSVNLMRTGNHLCMSDYISTTYSSTDGSSNLNRAVVVTDSVASLFTSTDPNGPGYKFGLEVFVCVRENSSISVGSSISLSVDVVYENGKTLNELVNFNVTDGMDLLLATGFVGFPNASTVVGNISTTVTIPQIIQISQTVDAFNISIEVPASGGSALANIKGISLNSTGSNFACVPYTFAEIDSTIISHTQVQQALYSLGYISNTGATNRSVFLDPSPVDDYLTINITVQILDHVMNTQNSLITITSSLTGILGTTWSGDSFVSVASSGVESPNLVFDIALEKYVEQKVSGDNITFHVNIHHDINSTAHAQEVIVHCMTPYYIEFGQLLTVEDANVTVDSSAPAYGIKLHVSEIDFNDNVSFSFSVVLDPAHVLPLGVIDLITTIPVDMTYRGPIRGDRMNTGYIHSDMSIFEISFDTEQVGLIGISTGLIQDCQITASSWQDTNTPADARLHTGVGWKPVVRGYPFCGEEYIQVNLGASSLLTGIKLQSSIDNHNDIPTSFRLMYSNDGQNWLYMYEIDHITRKNFTIDVTSGSSVNDVYDVELDPRLTTQHIRLVPSGSNCLIGLRLELMGVLGSGSSVDCNITATGNQLAERMYVVNSMTGTIFVCGSSGVDGPIYCSRSDEAGDAWYPVDDSVSNVVGTITNTSIVIGVSHDATSHVVSFDDGFTWEVVSTTELDVYMADPGYMAAVEFPNEDTRGQSFDTIYSAYGMDGDDFALTGCTDGIVVKRTGGTWETKAWWGTQEASTMA